MCDNQSTSGEKRARGLRPEGRGDPAMTRKDTWVDSPCDLDMSSTRSTLGASDYSKTGEDCVHREPRAGWLFGDGMIC